MHGLGGIDQMQLASVGPIWARLWHKMAVNREHNPRTIEHSSMCEGTVHPDSESDSDIFATQIFNRPLDETYIFTCRPNPSNYGTIDDFNAYRSMKPTPNLKLFINENHGNSS